MRYKRTVQPRAPRLHAIPPAVPETNGHAAPVTALKLDLGCGKNTKEGFEGVDRRNFPNVKHVVDLLKFPWPWADSSVDEVHCSHFLEHLDYNRHNPERVKFFNELWRVMKPNATATIITPHWCSNRAYGDPTHGDKPVSEMFYFYINKNWRTSQAPDTDIQWNPDGFSCDFDGRWGHSFGPELATKSQEYQTFALQNYKEAAVDLHATLKCLKT